VCGVQHIFLDYCLYRLTNYLSTLFLWLCACAFSIVVATEFVKTVENLYEERNLSFLEEFVGSVNRSALVKISVFV